jgi:hypothetical protein
VSLYADTPALVGHALHLFLSHWRDCVVVLSVAALLAMGCWLAATHYSRLWNLHFRSKPSHHVLCMLAAVSTLVFAVFFASMAYTKQAADISIETGVCNGPRLSSGRERSPVAEIIVTFKLARGLVPWG